MKTANPLIRSADVALIEAEVQFRLDAELERVRVEAKGFRASEITLAETIALERETRAITRVSAKVAEQYLRDIERIEGEAAVRLERAVAEARVAGEFEAREGLSEEIVRARREADSAAGRVRDLEVELARVRTAAEADRDAALQEVRLTAEEFRGFEAGRARVQAESDARARVAAPQLQARAVHTGPAESDHLSTDVARIEAEVESVVKPWLEQVRAVADQLQVVDAAMMEAAARRGVTEDSTRSRYVSKIEEIMEAWSTADSFFVRPGSSF
jgi:hypothetical protein